MFEQYLIESVEENVCDNSENVKKTNYTKSRTMKTTKERIEELGYEESYIYPEAIEYRKIIKYSDWITSLSVYFYPKTKEFEIEFNFFSSPEDLHMLVDEVDKLEVKNDENK